MVILDIENQLCVSKTHQQAKAAFRRIYGSSVSDKFLGRKNESIRARS